MRLLILSPIYAPDRSPRAYRWTALAEHWAAAGATVEVIAALKPGDARHERRNGVDVERVGGFLDRLRGSVGAGSHRSDAGGAGTVPSAGAGLRRLAKSAYDATLRRVMWPDYAFDWYLPARRAALLRLEAGRCDALVTVSHPFTPHLVGLALKQRWRDLRWLADIGDPFSLLAASPLNNRALYAGLNRRAESAVLRRADAVAVTVERCRRDLESAFPESAGRIAVVPPLLSLPAPVTGKAGLGPGTHLAAIGTLYRTLRHPGPLLALFATLAAQRDDLVLHLYGTLNDCADIVEAWRPRLGERLRVHGMVPREEVAAAMASADVLVNIGNSTADQLPSKLVEYAAAARPILNLAASPEDSAAAFLATYPATLTLPADPEPSAISIAAALSFLAAPPPVDPAAVVRFLAPYTLPSVAAAYEALLGFPAAA